MLPIASKIAVAFVAVIHIAISVVEMFFWHYPIVYQRLVSNAEIATQVAPIVQNAGLYNSFIAAGLIWGVLAKANSQSVRFFS